MKLRSVCLVAALALAATSLGAAEQEGVDVGGGRAVTVALGGQDSGGAPLQLAGAEIGSGARYALLENVGNGVALAGNETGHGNPLFSAEGAESGGGRPA